MFEYKQPLLQHISAHPLGITQVVCYALQIAEIVDDFARNMLVHGDLRLDNCLIGQDGHLWLCDLGLVQRCFAKKARFFSFHGAPELFAETKGLDL